MQMKNNVPFTFGVNILEARMDRYDNHITRKLSSMKGQYFDTHAFEAMLAESDQLLYEVYETRRPEVAGELLNGLGQARATVGSKTTAVRVGYGDS